VPWADSSLAKIPSNSNLDDREWLPVADVFPTDWSLLTRSGFEPGDSVAVFGAGAVGLMCAYSAIMRGASIVYVVDHVTSRLAKATQIGAMAIYFTLGGKASDQILALRPAGVKRTVDCVGEVCLDENLEPRQDYVLRETVKITRHQGGIGIAGVYMAGLSGQVTEAAENLGLSSEIKFPIAEAWSKGLRIHCGMVDLKEAVPQVMELIKTGRARPGFVFSNEYSIEDAPLAYSRFERWEESKVILKGARKKGDEKSLEIRNGSSGHGRNGSNTEA
jgi:threonine dehydrogenase-like Zn-dependent dehydrogenase